MSLYPICTLPFQDLAEESFDCAEPTIYAIIKESTRFEILVKREPASHRAVVFGTGAVTIPREEWPFYSRHSWMDQIPCNCIYYFDPTLYLGPVNLAWCYGTNERWFLREIAEILSVMLTAIGVLPENTLMMGSSGGGFTSIMLATLLRTRCQAINPQSDFRRYNDPVVGHLEALVLKPGEQWIESHVNVIELMREEHYVPFMHIIQNILVEEDIADHILPLISELCKSQLSCGYDRVRLDFYHHIDGHNGMPPQSKCLQYIQKDLEASLEHSELACDAEYCLSGRDLTVRLKVDFSIDERREYAYYLYRDKQILDRSTYSHEVEKTYHGLLPGRYQVKFFVRHGQEKQSFMMPRIRIS